MEIDLLMLPKIERDTKERARTKTEEQIRTSKKFGWEFFDKRGVCYDGYIYDGRWIPVVKGFAEYYNLSKSSKVLDVGCAKGYLLYDLKQLIPSVHIAGIDISEYAINCAPPEIKDDLFVADARDLAMFGDKEFDLAISLNVIHNFGEDECRQAVREIQRVSKKSYIVVDAYRNDYEKERLFEWVLTAETILSVDQWEKLFREEGYTGDYYWTTP